MDIQERRRLLFAVVDNAIEVRNHWSESDVDYLTQPVQDALDELVETFSVGDLPADCRDLAAAVSAFEREWVAWKDIAETSQDPGILPSMAVWKSFEQVASNRMTAEPEESMPLESVQELVEQGLNDRQIAMAYGFEKVDGSPDIGKAREERASPGRHTGPDSGWIPPRERERREREQKQADLSARVLEKQEARLKALNPKAPETLEDLVEQEVSLTQICRMLGLQPEQVYRECRLKGLPMPQTAYPSAHQLHGTFEREPNDAQKRQFAAMDGNSIAPTVEVTDDGVSEAAPMTLEQQIVHYAETTDWSHEEIAETVSTESAPVTRQKVSGVLRRHKNDPDVFKPAEV